MAILFNKHYFTTKPRIETWLMDGFPERRILENNLGKSPLKTSAPQICAFGVLVLLTPDSYTRRFVKDRMVAAPI